MTSSSIKNVSPSEAQSQVSVLPVDTFTEQLTHEPQRKAKLYSLPLIRTAIALITVFWVVGVYAGNPDGFWQVQTNTFMVAIAGFTVAWAMGGWMTCFARWVAGVAPPKRGGDVYVNSFNVPLAIRRESSGEWFKLVNRHLVVSLEGKGLNPGTAVIPLDLLEVSYDLLEGDNPRMEAHLSGIQYDTRYATWTLHLPVSYAKRWNSAFTDAKASERMVTGRESKFDSKAVRTYTWKSWYEWEGPYIGILALTLVGYPLVTSFIMSGITGSQHGVPEATVWGLGGTLLAPVVIVATGMFAWAEYIKYKGEAGDLDPWRNYCREAVLALTDAEKSAISSSGGWVFPLVKFPYSGRYSGWVSESSGKRQVALLAPSGRQYVLDLPRDTTVQYASGKKSSCAIATLKIGADGAEVVRVKLTLPKDV